MLYTGKQIVGRIKGHISKRGGTFPTWFVGVSKEPRIHLFRKHGVQKVGDAWILIHARSTLVARKVQSYLVRKLRLGEVPGPADPLADFVYAYKKSANTKP